MILTEAEAMKRWCPKAMSLTTIYVQGKNDYIAANRDMPGGNIPACIASHCMFWRFAEPKRIRDIDLVTSDVVELPPRTGYCGIAGKPEHE